MELMNPEICQLNIPDCVIKDHFGGGWAGGVGVLLGPFSFPDPTCDSLAGDFEDSGF